MEWRGGAGAFRVPGKTHDDDESRCERSGETKNVSRDETYESCPAVDRNHIGEDASVNNGRLSRLVPGGSGMTRRGLLRRGAALGVGTSALGGLLRSRFVAAQESDEPVDLTIWLEGEPQRPRRAHLLRERPLQPDARSRAERWRRTGHLGWWHRPRTTGRYYRGWARPGPHSIFLRAGLERNHPRANRQLHLFRREAVGCRRQCRDDADVLQQDDFRREQPRGARNVAGPDDCLLHLAAGRIRHADRP